MAAMAQSTFSGTRHRERLSVVLLHVVVSHTRLAAHLLISF
jgi:hypothetical protein